jgi:hypothetical protein
VGDVKEKHECRPSGNCGNDKSCEWDLTATPGYIVNLDKCRGSCVGADDTCIDISKRECEAKTDGQCLGEVLCTSKTSKTDCQQADTDCHWKRTCTWRPTPNGNCNNLADCAWRAGVFSQHLNGTSVFRLETFTIERLQKGEPPAEHVCDDSAVGLLYAAVGQVARFQRLDVEYALHLEEETARFVGSCICEVVLSCWKFRGAVNLR